MDCSARGGNVRVRLSHDVMLGANARAREIAVSAAREAPACRLRHRAMRPTSCRRATLRASAALACAPSRGDRPPVENARSRSTSRAVTGGRGHHNRLSGAASVRKVRDRSGPARRVAFIRSSRRRRRARSWRSGAASSRPSTRPWSPPTTLARRHRRAMPICTECERTHASRDEQSSPPRLHGRTNRTFVQRATRTTRGTN